LIGTVFFTAELAEGAEIYVFFAHADKVGRMGKKKHAMRGR
jgi:hypothetical protein